MRTYAYIDASNLFYGGKKSLGWSIDLEKLYEYLRERFGVSQIYYFGGVEIHKFPFDYLANNTVSLKDLERYLVEYVEKNKEDLTSAKLILFDRHLKQVHFYQKLEKFGYKLILKPVKMYEDEEGNQKRKANCDVEMTFYLMRDKNAFDRVIVLSGDGDFLPVLKHLRRVGKKEVLMLARGPRTAREIKRFAGDKFMDFEYLRERLRRTDMEEDS
ncbi:MAG: hypothetical protein UV64_C0019G0010 [Parcubacteria group bacterium GW2011_GWC1_43_11b]|nr:MAG: hypothetical protein UV50_C0009G0002 [Parcubacteria group bacterium GW2011_GWB1_42_9]KKS88670.1 MAG: hypothetical protein UV64_C0019G0010 [Parcubacteria group bacterium GW2011_GWC1_43_11b]